MTISDSLRRRLIVALADAEAGEDLAKILNAALGAQARTSTEWFNIPIEHLAGTGTPGTPTASAMGRFGAISVPTATKISAVHLHQIADGSAGTNTLELYRYRPSDDSWLLIATVSLAQGGGDFGFAQFTFVDAAYRELQANDYLYMQATAVMSGPARGFVDVHFEQAALLDLS